MHYGFGIGQLVLVASGLGQEYAPRLACTATARHSPSKCTSKHSRSVHATPPPPPPAPGPYPGPSPQPWPPAGFLRRAERGRLRPQAEWAFLNAVEQGDLATLKRLVEEGVNVNAKYVSAAPPAAPPSPLRPSPSALAARRPCCPAPRRRRSPRVAPPPRLRRTAGRPSCGRLGWASSTASSTSSPRVPSLTP